MKRFLNKVRRFEVSQITDAPYRYELDSFTPINTEDTESINEDELFIGEANGDEKGLFVYKTKNENGDSFIDESNIEVPYRIFSLSYDDFSYNFLDDENNRLNAAYSALQSNINALGTVPIMPDEDGGN